MADYKTVFGKKIKAIASDPPATVGKGEIWYNSASSDFKTSVKLEAWASGGAYTLAIRMGFGSGTQTAALYATGYVGPTPGPSLNLMPVASNEYDGSSWTAGGNVNNRRFIGASCGTQTASLMMGGNSPLGAKRAEVEEYNGTSWAEQSDLPTGTQTNYGLGIQTAALAIGGNEDPDITLAYDGSSWTSGGNINTGRTNASTAGTQTAGMIAGGVPQPAGGVTTAVEQYDGSSWTTYSASLSVGSSHYTSNNVGTSSRDTAIVAGGSDASGATGKTEIFDGSTWRTAPSMATARNTNITGDSSAAIAMTGGSNVTTVEEFSATDTIKTITDS